jgi:hypothetical protein
MLGTGQKHDSQPNPECEAPPFDLLPTFCLRNGTCPQRPVLRLEAYAPVRVVITNRQTSASTRLALERRETKLFDLSPAFLILCVLCVSGGNVRDRSKITTRNQIPSAKPHPLTCHQRSVLEMGPVPNVLCSKRHALLAESVLGYRSGAAQVDVEVCRFVMATRTGA